HGFESCVSRGDVMSWNGQWENLAVMALAAVVGGLVGLEREFADKPAGLRTHMFVAAGAALFMLMGNELIDKYHLDAPVAGLSADPIRIVQAIVIGISFLGAGTIVHQSGERVEGLTTAASIFFTAGLGIAVSLGQYVLASVAAAAAVCVLLAVGWLENAIGRARTTLPFKRYNNGTREGLPKTGGEREP
ncbi:MAG: MgtC/SapB family protein, partial [Planctomycetales bacterium]|nr:MgtC/SapB family protein [Planctomycetales bacterium]